MAFKVLSYIKLNKINTVHFDTTSGRFMPALPFLFRIKKIATIHDPNPHTGEESYKKTIIRKVYTKMVNNFLFYSRYSYRQFIHSHIHSHSNTFSAQLKPYSFISKLNTTSIKPNKYILYFGRISYYKGIDLLLEAFQSIVSHYPNLDLIIAGKGNIEYEISDEIHTNKIRFLNKYVPIQELAELINNAEFVVCPYREATQSGVLMTAFALNKPVLATNVGAFPEYVLENINGMLVEPNVNGIEKGILKMLNNNHYKDLEIQMKSFTPKRFVNNENIFSELYAN
jgi:glycosyltransferase involved in cell wall biosynthesis